MSSSYKLTLDTSEVSRCLLCKDPECEKACPQHGPVGDILRSLYFENYSGAAGKAERLDCSRCDAPCEKACIVGKKKLPVEVCDIIRALKEDQKALPAHVIEDVDLSTDICGVKLRGRMGRCGFQDDLQFSAA